MSRILVVVLLLLVAALVAVHGGDDESERLFELVEDNKLDELAKALDEAGANVDQRGPGGQTLLMYASLRGNVEAIKMLLERGADVTIPEEQGYTPLHGASFQGRAEAAKFLIEYGLDPVEYHKDGYAPFHRCLWGREDRHTDTLRVFLEAGVPADLPGPKGASPISISGNPNSIALLKEHLAKADAEDKDEL